MIDMLQSSIYGYFLFLIKLSEAGSGSLLYCIDSCYRLDAGDSEFGIGIADFSFVVGEGIVADRSGKSRSEHRVGCIEICLY